MRNFSQSINPQEVIGKNLGIFVAEEVVDGQLDYFSKQRRNFDQKVVFQQKAVSAEDTHPLPSSQHVRRNP